jgi:glycosyltransferase involved in cell wall biosynthesis
MDSIVTLTASLPNTDMLLERALPSIKWQIWAPTASIIVFDNEPPSIELISKIKALLHPIKTHIMVNRFESGAAGSWNTGLEKIYDEYPASYVAILDDDDQWDHNHLSECAYTALMNKGPDVVLSGLRMKYKDQFVPRDAPANFTVDDFLTGNPGWQGSNTFISSHKIEAVDGFTAGMRSSNDRDLAIRLLSLPKLTIGYTKKFTATWYCGERVNALSHPGSKNKLYGLAQFYRSHGSKMTQKQKVSFFQRSKRLFHFSEQDIKQTLNWIK